MSVLDFFIPPHFFGCIRLRKQGGAESTKHKEGKDVVHTRTNYSVLLLLFLYCCTRSYHKPHTDAREEGPTVSYANIHPDTSRATF